MAVSALVLMSCCKLLMLFALLYRLWLGRCAALQQAQAKGSGLPRPAVVAIQLPLYNEAGQVAGLLAAVCRLQWHGPLVVQVLDDSDDPACQREVDDAVAEWLGYHERVQVSVVRRGGRSGYKAGALNYGMALLPSVPYFAIFDADFRPEPDFLMRLMPEFGADPKICAVQAAWSFANTGESLLTRMQATMLGLHFHVEHVGREALGYCLNFNGTAGIWSRQALEDLGGWSSASVTEDLLLSYRAAMLGMRVKFVGSVSCVSELPGTLRSFLIQQRRWAEGHGQVNRLLRKELLAYGQWSWLKKADALLHLNSYSLAALLNVTLLVLPIWLVGRQSFFESVDAAPLWRLAEGGLWLVVAFVFFRLYSHVRAQSGAGNAGRQTLHPSASWRLRLGQGMRSILMSRFSQPFVFLAAAPYLSTLLMGHFLRGFLVARKHPPVFHRTPKAVQTRRDPFLQFRDAAVVAGVSLYLLSMALLAAWLNVGVASIILFGQALAVPSWLVLSWAARVQLAGRPWSAALRVFPGLGAGSTLDCEPAPVVHQRDR